MKKNLLLTISLLANAVLAALLLTRTSPDDSSQTLTRPPANITATTEVSRVVRKAESRHETNVTTVAGTNATAPLPNIWKQVAAPDYQQFADNLRSIGVPEETVRDIVMFDLLKSLAEDVEHLVKRKERPYWQASTVVTPQPSITNEVKLALTQLTSVSQTTLGIDPADWFADRWGWTERVGNDPDGGDFDPLMLLFKGMTLGEYPWLDTQRSRELNRLELANWDARQAIEKKLAGLDRRSPEFEALQLELSKLIQEGEKLLDKFMTTAEHHERALREDEPLQRQLVGVVVSREEYEKLHDLARSTGATKAPYFPPGTPAAAQAEAILGSERFAEFLRGADPVFVTTAAIFNAHGLPHESARRVDDIRRACLQRIQAGADAEAERNRAFAEMQALIPDNESKLDVFRQLQDSLRARP